MNNGCEWGHNAVGAVVDALGGLATKEDVAGLREDVRELFSLDRDRKVSRRTTKRNLAYLLGLITLVGAVWGTFTYVVPHMTGSTAALASPAVHAPATAPKAGEPTPAG